MKPIDKARELVKKHSMGNHDQDALIKAIEAALVEQDRNARHACAEAILGLPGCHTANDNAIYDADGNIVDKAICANEAHFACSIVIVRTE